MISAAIINAMCTCMFIKKNLYITMYLNHGNIGEKSVPLSKKGGL